MLTNKAKYSLRAMCALSLLPQGGRLQAHAIAERTNVPVKFLEAILVDLRRAGFVESRRGQLGGHALARPATEIRLGAIVRSLEEGQPLVECFAANGGDCTIDARCRLKARLRAAEAAFMADLDRSTLADIALRPDLRLEEELA